MCLLRDVRTEKKILWGENPSHVRDLSRPWCGNYRACCYVSRVRLLKHLKKIFGETITTEAVWCVCCAVCEAVDVPQFALCGCLQHTDRHAAYIHAACNRLCRMETRLKLTLSAVLQK